MITPHKRFPSFLVTAALALVSAGASQAQTSSSDAPAPVSSASDEIVVLKPFDVTAEQMQGYRVSSASTATRTNTALIDIPQTVDIMTKEMWSDMGATTFDQSFRYVSNVYVRNRNAGGGDTVNLRGFETSGSIAVDGVRVGSYKRDLVGYERLEVVKGPPSAVQGRAGGTGLLNYILKKPDLDRNFTTLKYTTGMDEYDDAFNRVEVDSNYRIWKDKMSARLAAAWQRSDDYINFQDSRIFALYPSFRWAITDKTDLVFTGEFIDSNTPSREEGHGFALYPGKLRRLIPQFAKDSDPITALNLPYDFAISGPGNEDKEKVAVGTLFFTHTFNDYITFRQVGHWRYQGADTFAWTGEDNFNTVMNSQRTGGVSSSHNTTAQGDLITKYGWRDWVHASTLVGYSYSNNSGVTDNSSGIPNAPFNKIDIVALAGMDDSIDYFDGRTVTLKRSSYTTAHSYNFGYYGEQIFSFWKDRIIASGGLRRDHDHSETQNLVTNTRSAFSDTTLNSYRYGVTVKVMPKLAVYAVRSVQTDPTRTIQRYNGLLPGDPRNSEFFTVNPLTNLKEIGIKTDLFNGRVTAAAAYWQMTKEGSVQNILTNGTSMGQPVTFGTQTVIQGAQSKGYEISFFGNVTDRLSIVANFADMETSQQNTASQNLNDRIPIRFAPDWNLNTFARYSFRDSHNHGLLLKAGISLIGPVWTQVTGVGLTHVPHVQKSLDAGAAYRIGNYDVDFMVTNLGNDPFLITRDQPPRTYRLSITTNF
ncbi:MAG TPA: TonB-dependent receptor plug domain-containing protein [Opitutaceae bacterium]|nr:TonB-dependent receptor plug domain-containing protein [Opitutaceae bacterium]